MKKVSKGFTLIEILVVIAIIGILSAIILVSLNSARTNAKDARIVSDLTQMRNSLELYYDGSTQTYDLKVVSTSFPNYVGPYAGTAYWGFPDQTDFNNIVNLLLDIGVQNNHPAGNLGIGKSPLQYLDIGYNWSAINGLTAPVGAIIFTSAVARNGNGTTPDASWATDYAIYAKTSSSYACVDSYGHFVKGGQGTLTTPLNAIPLDNGRVTCK